MIILFQVTFAAELISSLMTLKLLDALNAQILDGQVMFKKFSRSDKMGFPAEVR